MPTTANSSTPAQNPSATGADPTNPAVAPWESVLRYAPRYLEFQRAFGRQPGFQVAVAVDGAPIGTFSGGFADLGDRSPLTDRHLFRVASHSKSFTATAVMQLVEDKALRLDDELAAHLPELAGSDLAEATVGELLSHSAGVVRDGADSDFWSLARPFPDRAELVEMARAGRVVERNERFKYTNVGYGLLGLVIEAVSGRGYHEHLRNRVLEPLGLADTGPELDARAGELAAGYSSLAAGGEPYGLEQRVPIDHIDTGALAAATGFYSTATDMVSFFSAHLPSAPLPSGHPPAAPGGGGTGALLSEAGKRRMRRRVEESGVPGHAYGLGLILQEVHGSATLGHSGGYPGHNTRTWAVPDTGVVLSVLTNAVDGPAAAWGEALFALAGLAAREAPASYAGASREELRRFEGRFSGLWGTQDIVELGGMLYAIPLVGGLEPEHLVPLERVDGTTLRSVDPNGFGGYGETLRFEFDDGGAAAVRGPAGMRSVRHEDFRLPGRVSLP
ncbi:MAG: serine hydrolase domain-containing protein [Arthrobacter sp.]|uniref:serine hydrolase domain-containing protein n=1 Tax=Arthrobacter sp. TaxID=1667 RepID=UPI00347FF855